ncbi:MAG: hypothetical protein V8S72_00615 [Oscillospiraceae bacterium]
MWIVIIGYTGADLLIPALLSGKEAVDIQPGSFCNRLRLSPVA